MEIFRGLGVEDAVRASSLDAMPLMHISPTLTGPTRPGRRRSASRPPERGGGRQPDGAGHQPAGPRRAGARRPDPRARPDRPPVRDRARLIRAGRRGVSAVDPRRRERRRDAGRGALPRRRGRRPEPGTGRRSGIEPVGPTGLEHHASFLFRSPGLLARLGDRRYGLYMVGGPGMASGVLLPMDPDDRWVYAAMGPQPVLGEPAREPDAAIGAIRAAAGVPDLEVELLASMPLEFAAQLAPHVARRPDVPRRRRRAPDAADRRSWHEHRDRRRGEPGLEARLGRERVALTRCSTRTRPSGCRRPAQPVDAAVAVPRPGCGERLRARPARRRSARGHAGRAAGGPRLPLRVQREDRRRRRPGAGHRGRARGSAGTPRLGPGRRGDRLHHRPRGGRAAPHHRGRRARLAPVGRCPEHRPAPAPRARGARPVDGSGPAPAARRPVDRHGAGGHRRVARGGVRDRVRWRGPHPPRRTRRGTLGVAPGRPAARRSPRPWRP